MGEYAETLREEITERRCSALRSSGPGISEMSLARLQELEEMAAKLLATARKLSPGQDRHSALREIGRFRARIAALNGREIAAGASRAESEAR